LAPHPALTVNTNNRSMAMTMRFCIKTSQGDRVKASSGVHDVATPTSSSIQNTGRCEK
jgi:hypothetical protein